MVLKIGLIFFKPISFDCRVKYDLGIHAILNISEALWKEECTERQTKSTLYLNQNIRM